MYKQDGLKVTMENVISFVEHIGYTESFSTVETLEFKSEEDLSKFMENIRINRESRIKTKTEELNDLKKELDGLPAFNSRKENKKGK